MNRVASGNLTGAHQMIRRIDRTESDFDVASGDSNLTGTGAKVRGEDSPIP
jgi:hypothetical protein